MDYETFLDREPVFTGSDLAAYLRGQGLGTDADAACRRLGTLWQEQGRVVAVRPDVWAVVGDGGPAEGFQPWSWLVASNLAPDAVLSHLSAVDYWGCFVHDVVQCGVFGDPVTVYGPEPGGGHEGNHRLNPRLRPGGCASICGGSMWRQASPRVWQSHIWSPGWVVARTWPV